MSAGGGTAGCCREVVLAGAGGKALPQYPQCWAAESTWAPHVGHGLVGLVMDGSEDKVRFPRRQTSSLSVALAAGSRYGRAALDRRIYDDARWQRGEPVTLTFDGHPVRAFAGEPLAVALHAAGVKTLSRSLKYHRPRTFFCLSGHCCACLVRVDGVPNVRACQEPCRDGQTAHGQNAYPSTSLDVMAAADWFFPRGMDHHTLMTGSKIANSVMQKFVRKLSGLGTVPETRPDPASYPDARDESVDVLVVGAGPAGLAAATSAAGRGARVVCIDEQHQPGGSLLCDPRFGPAEANQRAEGARAAGVDLRLRSPALAFYPEDGDVIAIDSPRGLVRMRATCTVYATGGHDAPGVFPDNDRPGVFSARAVGRLLATWGVLAGQRVVIAGTDEHAGVLGRALEDSGAEVVRVPSPQHIKAVHGTSWITGIDLEDRHEACDALAVSTTPSPASDMARQHEATVQLSATGGGFGVVTDADGRTSRPDVWATGDVTGFMGPQQAALHGERVGLAAAEAAHRGPR